MFFFIFFNGTAAEAEMSEYGRLHKPIAAASLKLGQNNQDKFYFCETIEPLTDSEDAKFDDGNWEMKSSSFIPTAN